MVRDEPGHVVTGLAAGSAAASPAAGHRISGRATRAPAYCRGVVTPDELVDRLLEAPLALAALADHAGLLPLFTRHEAGLGPGRRRRAGREVHRAARAADLRRADGGRGRGGHHPRRAVDLRGARHRGGGLPPGRRARPPGRGGRPAVLRRPRPTRGARGPGVVGLRARAPAPARPAVPGLRRRLRRRGVHLRRAVDGHRPAHRGARAPWPRRGSSTSHRSAAGTSRCGPAHGPTRS